MSEMHRFHNALRIMVNIERHELADGGLVLSPEGWWAFQSDPYRWFIRASDADAVKVWALIESRQRPRAFAPADAVEGG